MSDYQSARARQRGRDREGVTWQMERMWRGEKYSYLRDVWVKDENHAAELAEKMIEKSPALQNHMAGMKAWYGMPVMDQETFKGHISAFKGGKEEMYEQVGHMPLFMLQLLWSQDPDILKDKKRVYEFLNKNKGYKVPGSRSVPL